MRIHYFQRYHQKENVATANTMLLLSRLYQYSPDKFYRALKEMADLDDLEPGPIFTIQEKNKDSIPDATIAQAGFKVVVETKLGPLFNLDQLNKHLEAFGPEAQTRILLTLAPQPMESGQLAEFDELLAQSNRSAKRPVIHVNKTFSDIIREVADVLDDRDFEMLDVLEDYRDFCEHDGLISVTSSNLMHVWSSKRTFEANLKGCLYHRGADKRISDFSYLGLYKEKSVRAIGKVASVVRATVTENPTYEILRGTPPSDYRARIATVTEGEVLEGYAREEPRFFFVDEFLPTNFRKTSKGGLWGDKVFDLSDVLGLKELPETEEIANLLGQHTWE